MRDLVEPSSASCRGSELTRARFSLANGSQELTCLVKHLVAPNQIGILDVSMTFGYVNVAVGRIGRDIVRVDQRVRRISTHARLAQRHQHLAFGTKLDDNGQDSPARSPVSNGRSPSTSR